MVKLQNILLIGVLGVLVCCVHFGSAIRCYECNSHLNPNCSMNMPPDSLSVECGDHKHGVSYTFCRKITQVIEFSVNNLPPDSRVIRGCGWDDSAYKNKCYQRSGFGGRLEVCACANDNCNGAVSVQSINSVLGVLCPLVILAVFTRFF